MEHTRVFGSWFQGGEGMAVPTEECGLLVHISVYLVESTGWGYSAPGLLPSYSTPGPSLGVLFLFFAV